MEQHAQAAVLQVQVDHGHACFEAVMQRERDIAAQRSYATAPNQARNRINRRQPALLELAPSFAPFEKARVTSSTATGKNRRSSAPACSARRIEAGVRWGSNAINCG